MKHDEIRDYFKSATRRVRAGNLNRPQCTTGEHQFPKNIVVVLNEKPKPKFRHWAEKRVSATVIRRRRYS